MAQISGGNNKQGFPMKQGVLTHGHVYLLLSKGHFCHGPRRNEEKKYKSVQSCFVDANEYSQLDIVGEKKRLD